MTLLRNNGGDKWMGARCLQDLFLESLILPTVFVIGDEENGREPIDGNMLEPRKVAAAAMEEAAGFRGEIGEEGVEHEA